MKLLIVAAVTGAVWAGDTDFNGRWNLTVNGDPRNRAWWLEVAGAGGKQLKGRFVGAPGGQTDDIPELRIERGQLEFAFTRKYRVANLPAAERRALYRARLEGGKLIGTVTADGTLLANFSGERAPVIRDKDDGAWKPGKAITLFNGRDLSGWRTVTGASASGWSVRDGLLVNSEKAPDIVSQEKFWNFELHAEFRVGPKSNSGIALRDRYEIQIQEDYGRAVDTHSMGAVYSRVVPSENASRPAGEWQTLDVRLVGRIVTVKLNGKTVIERKEIEGLTAMAHDPNEAMPGPLSIQGDHGLVEFRALTLTPLVR